MAPRTAPRVVMTSPGSGSSPAAQSCPPAPPSPLLPPLWLALLELPPLPALATLLDAGAPSDPPQALSARAATV
jgi:hypothetical protein